MELTLISPQQRLAQGEQVLFGIQGLAGRPEGGTYIVCWNIEPQGSITPAGDTIFVGGADKVYSVFAAAQPDAARAAFDVRAADVPVTVTADIRYSQGRILPAGADAAYATAQPVATAATTVPGSAPAAAAGAGAPAVAQAPTGGGPGGSGLSGGAALPAQPLPPGPVVATNTVSMTRAAVDPTASQALWTLIRQSTNALSFGRYEFFLEQLLTGKINNQTGQFQPKWPPMQPNQGPVTPTQVNMMLPWRLPFPGVEPYRQLKAATEVFVMLNCAVPFDQFGMTQNGNQFLSPTQQWFSQFNSTAALTEESIRYGRTLTPDDIKMSWQFLLERGMQADAGLPGGLSTILYLALVRANLPDVRVGPPTQGTEFDLSPQATLELDQGAMTFMSILREKLVNPPILDLIWPYWMEEGGLVQTMNAITWRFQNRRAPGARDPLAALEIDPLRPVSNIIWGFIQDERNRLSVVRRAYEYAHEYGLTLLGDAVPDILPADNRSRFIESLHNLLHLCARFYKEDDDTTIVADGFPLLNALKEVHLLLGQGASNQYGDLPWTARLEMLMEQWLLARPEFREYLPRRIMVDYPERWMHSVESMKTLQGWGSADILHFRDLATFGEQILLSIRYEAWPSIIEPQAAANWARYWRPEIQGYTAAYRAATSVDVTQRPDATAPALLLRERMRESLPPAGRGRLERPKPVIELPMASRLEETRLDR